MAFKPSALVPARYDSICPCGLPIEEGELIGKLDGEWVCEQCYEEHKAEFEVPASLQAL